MDFSVIFQLRTKKFWWMDVIFYFVMSLLVATVLCWLIFLVKNNMQRSDIQAATDSLKKVGTDEQKAEELQVITYQKKINDFTSLFVNHQFASNAFAFMQKQTMSNVWYKQFSLDRKGAVIQLSGETDDLDALSRQVADLEKNEYIKNIGSISSTAGDSAKSEFNYNLTMDPKIFTYIADMSLAVEASPSDQQATQPEDNSNSSALQTNAQKLITAFHILLTPDVSGMVDQKKYTISINVPFGTDVKKLIPEIVTSPGATVLPASNTPQDFTNPVTYIVTAQDKSTQGYLVAVNVLPKISKEESASKTNILIIIITIVAVVAIASGIIGFLAWKKMKSKKTNIK